MHQCAVTLGQQNEVDRMDNAVAGFNVDRGENQSSGTVVTNQGGAIHKEEAFAHGADTLCVDNGIG